MRIILICIATIITITYPLVVYFGIQRYSPAVFSLLFLGLAAIRLFLSRGQHEPSLLLTLGAITLYSICLALTNSEYLLKLYPAFVSYSVATLFLGSLSQDQSLIERTARANGKIITAPAKFYTRRLTAVWGGVLIINGSISLYLALLGSREHWALYSGLISYACFALLFIGEYAYRRSFIAKHEAE